MYGHVWKKYILIFRFRSILILPLESSQKECTWLFFFCEIGNLKVLNDAKEYFDFNTRVQSEREYLTIFLWNREFGGSEWCQIVFIQPSKIPYSTNTFLEPRYSDWALVSLMKWIVYENNYPFLQISTTGLNPGDKFWNNFHLWK